MSYEPHHSFLSSLPIAVSSPFLRESYDSLKLISLQQSFQSAYRHKHTALRYVPVLGVDSYARPCLLELSVRTFRSSASSTARSNSSSSSDICSLYRSANGYRFVILNSRSEVLHRYSSQIFPQLAISRYRYYKDQLQ